MKNTELLELIIDEEDESGVDYIALVDSPAIESEWMAFKNINLKKLLTTIQSQHLTMLQRH